MSDYCQDLPCESMSKSEKLTRTSKMARSWKVVQLPVEPAAEINSEDGEMSAEATEELKAQVHKLQQKPSIAIDDKTENFVLCYHVKEEAKSDLR